MRNNDFMRQYRPWAQEMRRHGKQAVVAADRIGRNPWGEAPGLRLALVDLIDAARADAAQCGLPPAKRPNGPLTLSALVRNYVDGLLTRCGVEPLSDDEIVAATAEHLDEAPEVHLVHADQQTGKKSCTLIQPPRGAQ